MFAAAAALAVVLTGCTAPAPTADQNAQPSPTTTAVETAPPLPTPTALPPIASDEDEVVPEEPVEYVDADPSLYRTWMGVTPDNQAPHLVGLEGDHSELDGVDFVTADGRIVCSMYSPYYLQEDGTSVPSIFCFAADAPQAGCRSIYLGSAYGTPTPPSCGYSKLLDLTGAPVQTLPAGSSLTWDGLVCIAWRVDAVNCTGNGYQFGGASANGFFSFG